MMKIILPVVIPVMKIGKTQVKQKPDCSNYWTNSYVCVKEYPMKNCLLWAITQKWRLKKKQLDLLIFTISWMLGYSMAVMQ